MAEATKSRIEEVLNRIQEWTGTEEAWTLVQTDRGGCLYCGDNPQAELILGWAGAWAVDGKIIYGGSLDVSPVGRFPKILSFAWKGRLWGESKAILALQLKEWDA